jgi:hypothetical protein
MNTKNKFTFGQEVFTADPWPSIDIIIELLTSNEHRTARILSGLVVKTEGEDLSKEDNEVIVWFKGASTATYMKEKYLFPTATLAVATILQIIEYHRTRLNMYKIDFLEIAKSAFLQLNEMSLDNFNIATRPGECDAIIGESNTETP